MLTNKQTNITANISSMVERKNILGNLIVGCHLQAEQRTALVQSLNKLPDDVGLHFNI